MFSSPSFVTTYGHNLPTGAQTSVTDANGNATTYGYTDSTYTKMQQVLSGSTSVVYAYDGNKVDSISLGYGANNTYNETYSFDYDDFGNVKKNLCWLHCPCGKHLRLKQRTFAKKHICQW